MYQVEFSPKFKKRVKKIDPQTRKILLRLLKLFQQNPFNPKLKTHKLSGKLNQYFAFSVKSNLRIIFFLDHKSLILIDIGSHDQVYR